MKARHALGAALLLLACGGGGSSPDPAAPPGNNNPPNNPPANPPSGAPLTATVTMRSQVDEYGYGESHSFNPGHVAIRAGGSVTFTNSSPFLHNVTFASANAPARVPDLAGGSAARVFNTAGTYNYQCTNHSGMSGTVVVE